MSRPCESSVSVLQGVTLAMSKFPLPGFSSVVVGVIWFLCIMLSLPESNGRSVPWVYTFWIVSGAVLVRLYGTLMWKHGFDKGKSSLS